jgi:hypothetical protein
MGSGLGSSSKEQVRKIFSEILPEMFQLAADGLLVIEILEGKLKDIAELWNLEITDGQRLVVMIGDSPAVYFRFGSYLPEKIQKIIRNIIFSKKTRSLTSQFSVWARLQPSLNTGISFWRARPLN